MRSTRIPCEIEWYRAVGIFALRLYTGNVETQGVFDVTGLKECPARVGCYATANGPVDCNNESLF